MAPGDETRNRLLDAAGRIFAEKGFASATVREICQLADANIAAVNYHFGDKERLYIEAVREAQCARQEFAPMPDWNEHVSAEDRLRDFVRAFLARTLESSRPDWHLGLMLRELAHPTDACTEIVRDYIRPMAEVLAGILMELLPQGSDLKTHHLVGFSIVGQCLFYYVNKPIIRELVGTDEYETYDIDLLSDHIARFTLAAIQHRLNQPTVPQERQS